jgi:hypothetical protein
MKRQPSPEYRVEKAALKGDPSRTLEVDRPRINRKLFLFHLNPVKSIALKLIEKTIFLPTEEVPL